MKPVNQRRWKVRKKLDTSDPRVDDLSKQLNIDPLTAQVLLMRDVDNAREGKDFLEAKLSSLPDPDLLPDMAVACHRLGQSLKSRERISVHGDYDVDGITGCTLLVETLRNLGAEVTYHIPLRLKDGYGLSAEAVQATKAQGCQLLISVDCGISAHAEADLAAELGLDLIITDHHQPSEDLPECLAVINPHLRTNRFPWKDLSGVGVAFFLLVALRRYLREDGFFKDRPEPDLRQGLDLVAMGTVADIVPLGGVNRILVRSGLQLLEKGQRPGIAALKSVSEVTQVTSGVVGFRLAPRLNAAGRIEDAALGVELLLKEKSQDALPLAQLLDDFNRERQQLEQQVLSDAINILESDQYNDDRRTIVLASENWHSGVIGIVASRLVERYHRPTVLISLTDGEPGKGSARSVPGLNLFRALTECRSMFLGFGGHSMAAGLSIAAENIADFQGAFEKIVDNMISTDDLCPLISHDGDIQLTRLSRLLVKELDGLNPFGMGNPQPAFVSRGCRVLEKRILVDKHLKFVTEQAGKRLDCIAFGLAERFDELNETVDLLYRPSLNSWRGKESVQLQIVDFSGSIKEEI